MKYNLVSYQSDNKENPGFYASKPMRGAARGRQDDTLILQIFHTETSAYWQSQLAKLARNAAKAYYQSPGSVTRAMRSAIERVNKALRVQNSGLRVEQSPESAALMVAVLRDGELYLTQAGHASALLVSGAGTRLFFDESIHQQGLGLSESLELRYFKTDFFGADYLLMGAPETMQAFDRESPTPSSVIRMVNEIKDLPSAYSLTKIGLGDGKVENRLLSLAMLLDESAPELEPQADPQPETPTETPVQPQEEDEPELVDEIVDEQTLKPDDLAQTLPFGEQLALPIEDEAILEHVAEQVEELAEEEKIFQPETEEAESPAFIVDIVDDQESHPEAETEVVSEEEVEDIEEEPQSYPVEEKPVIIDVLPQDESLAQDPVEESPVFDPEFGGEEDLPVEELKPELVVEDEERIVVEESPSEVYSQYQDEPESGRREEVIIEPEWPTDSAQDAGRRKPADVVEEPQAPPEPDPAAIARQERLEKLKKGALTGIARGAGWLRGVEEGAQLTKRRAELRASAAGQDIPPLSPFTKWAIVIIVPLLVVAIAVGIYFSRGLDKQYLNYLNQAQTHIKTAKESDEPAVQREAWVQAVVWLNQAREFNQGDTAEIIALRNEAQGELDRMDGVRRLMLSKAFGKTLYPDLFISHLVTSQNGVFVLDKISGNILRFYQAGGAYLLDSKFACGPASYGELEVGPIIDITDISGTSPNDTAVIGIDANGNLVFCSGSGKGHLAASLTPPEGGLGSIDAIHFGNDGLYLLDVAKNRIWVYRGLSDLFAYEPGSYLDKSDADLSGAVDLFVRRDGLFVLFDDGRMVFSNVPAFNGFVEAQEPSMPWQAAQGKASQISGQQVADNVLYFLEPKEPSIARYSYRLVPSDVLKVSFGDDATPRLEASAVAVSSSQTVFIAFGNELYFAQLP
jgi:hypothetical protein